MGIVRHILETNDIGELTFLRHAYIDISDKLNWQFTVNLLVIFMFILSNASSFVNKIISCTVPINFSPNQEEYANEVCYISDKYSVLDNERVYIYKNSTKDMEPNYVETFNSKTKSHQESPMQISYYVWVPYILLIQAFLYVFPKYIWKYFLKHITNLDMNETFKASTNCRNVASDENLENFIQKI